LPNNWPGTDRTRNWRTGCWLRSGCDRYRRPRNFPPKRNFPHRRRRGVVAAGGGDGAVACDIGAYDGTRVRARVRVRVRTLPGDGGAGGAGSCTVFGSH